MTGRLEHSVKGLRGRKSWACGSVRTFLCAGLSDWQQARDSGRGPVGIFYTNITKKFIAKYGWYWDPTVDKECPDPTDDEWANIRDHTGLNEEEVQRRNTYFRELRKKITQWYLHNYGKVNNTEEQIMEVQKMISKMAEALPTPPRKKQIMQYYSAEYYKDPAKGIKAFVDRTWPAVRANPTPPGKKKLRHLEYANKITAQYYAKETAEFKAQLVLDRDEEFRQAQKEYREKLEALDSEPQTAEEYHTALANSAGFLQPLADLAARRFGAAVSILMVVPIGVNKGNIELRSVHSGVTNTLNPQIWPDFDPLGFDAVETSFVNFGKKVFSPAEQEKRVYVIPDESEESAASLSNPDLLSMPDSDRGTPNPTVSTDSTLQVGNDVNPTLESPLTSSYRIDDAMDMSSDCTQPAGAIDIFGDPYKQDNFFSMITTSLSNTSSQIETPTISSSITPLFSPSSTPYAVPSILPNAANIPSNLPDGANIPSLLPNEVNVPSNPMNDVGIPSILPSNENISSIPSNGVDILPNGIAGTLDNLPTGTWPTTLYGVQADSPRLLSQHSTPQSLGTILPLPTSLAPPSVPPAVSSTLGHHMELTGDSRPSQLPSYTPLPSPLAHPALLPAPPDVPGVSDITPAPIFSLDVEDIPPEAKTTYAPVLEHAQQWGDLWCNCVSAFLAFERSRGFSMKSYQLPTTKRPALIKKWLNLHRPSSGANWDALGNGDGAAYGVAWWAWWVEIQPKGRRSEGEFALARRDAGPLSWRCLSKSGPSGLLLVLVSLLWWKMMVGNADDNWREAVVDVTWALHEMKSTPAEPESKKRKQSDITTDASAPPQKQVEAPVSSGLRKERRPTKKARGIAV
ncbi:hypothetical protein HWV62_27834 [Athelia sp. TMB]|nr:hypothetical protein HWV62_27834 [Athelia sp. TMB]